MGELVGVVIVFSKSNVVPATAISVVVVMAYTYNTINRLSGNLATFNFQNLIILFFLLFLFLYFFFYNINILNIYNTVNM